MNLLFVDPSWVFLSDCETKSFLDDYEESFEVFKAKNLSEAEKIIKEQAIDALILNAAFLEGARDLDISLPLAVYAKTKTDVYTVQEEDIAFYGFITNAEELFDAIALGEVKPRPLSSSTSASKEMVENEQLSVRENKDTSRQMSPSKKNETNKNKDNKDRNHNGDSRRNNPKKQEEHRNKKEETYSDTTKKNQEAPAMANDFRSRIKEAKRKEEEEKRKKALLLSKNSKAKEKVLRDVGFVKKPAKVITVYSAKGGVGKTKISSELATFLALTASGRKKLKVCLVDCNIDFGDVLYTLSYNANGPCMMDWYSDIEVKMEEGIPPENIEYSESEIARFLQRKETDGLYALIAPMTNEDSMEIDGMHIEVMMRNLINNGEFDYIVVDTGNNTRDSSFIPLQMSDVILMVLTQDANTAKCNLAFLQSVESMNRFGDEALSLDKIKLAINQIRPAKAVDLGIKELEECFVNPNTDEYFEVWAKIKSAHEVARATNNGEPLVYNSSSDFTRSIAQLAATIIGEQQVLEPPKKKVGIFAKLFKRG